VKSKELHNRDPLYLCFVFFGGGDACIQLHSGFDLVNPLLMSLEPRQGEGVKIPPTDWPDRETLGDSLLLFGKA